MLVRAHLPSWAEEEALLEDTAQASSPSLDNSCMAS